MSVELPKVGKTKGPDAEAVILQWTWKTDAMRGMTLDACRLALERGALGKFSALDLPKHGAAEHGGTGIAGTVFSQLARAGIIAQVGVLVGGKFYPERIQNAGGNPVALWHLISRPLASAMLRVHGGHIAGAAVQTDFFDGSAAGENHGHPAADGAKGNPARESNAAAPSPLFNFCAGIVRAQAALVRGGVGA